MKCPICNTENSMTRRFCRECGVKLALVCPQCSTENSTGDKFCGKCGQKLDLEPRPASNETAPVGERKYVTILFSDISGYTAMAERLDPEEVKEITGQIFGKVSKIVSDFGGFIEKYAGDAVMVLFGADLSHEDDPMRAVKAAAEIHDRVEGLSLFYEEKIGSPLTMHSGINTGLVVTGELNFEKGVHGVAGDAVNVAARLSSAAKAGEILVDHETYTRTEGYFQYEDLEPLQLKGKSKSVPVHKFLAVKEQPRKIHRLHGLRAELVGRKAEMVQLSEAADNLQQGKGAAISITGAAGTGKSRLIEELKATLDLKAFQWLEGNAFPYAQNIPYFPLIDLISKSIQIDEGDSPQSVKEKLESSLEFLTGESQNVAPYIGSLYALDYPEIAAVSPEFWKAELQKAVLMVLTALGRSAPTIICLEDLHWADPSSVDLVHFLLSEIRQPVLFLCVYRPLISLFSIDQIDNLAIPHQELQLRDLSFSESHKMVESLLQMEIIPKDLQHFIRNKVEGNPFYLEEVINSLIESNTLVPENGDWKVNGPITESEISATIQGVISARVDRLEQESKRVLQEASVIGRSFYFDILRRITDIKDNLDQNLSGLERFDLIKTKAIQPYLEYIFKHALTQEVVYNGLLKKERREIHERIGYVIEELFKDRIPEFYETLAYHFKYSKSEIKAIDYLMRSGEKSLKRSSVDESHQSYKEAFAILTPKENGAREYSEKLITLIVDWALVFYYRGDFKGLTELLEAHVDIAKSLENKATLGMFCALLGLSLYFRARTKESYQYLLKAYEIGQELNNPKITGYASTWLATTCADMGLFDEAIKYGLRAQEIAEILTEDQYLYFKSLWGLSYIYFCQGYGKSCSQIGRRLLDYGSKYSNIRCLVVGHICIGLGYNAAGDFPAAIQSLEQGVAVAADPFYAQWAKLFLGANYLFNEQLTEAEGALKEVQTYCINFGSEMFVDLTSTLLGIIAITKGRMSAGSRAVEAAKKRIIESERNGWIAFWENMLGSVYLQMVQGGKKPNLSFLIKNASFLIKNAPHADRKAETHFNNATEQAKKFGNKGILGIIYLNLGLLHKAKKRVDKAKECLKEAVKIFEETEAERFLKQAREVMASLASIHPNRK